jgi:ABC-type Mn2+/Zn2+ transport system ATPase subunit
MRPRAGRRDSPSAAVEPVRDLLVQAQHVDLAYGAVDVVRDASLEVRRGDFWFLLGGNGSGKTTLLRALLGIVPPRAGRLWLSPDLHGRAGIGFVPQHCAINPSLPTTVREFVSLGLVGLPVAGEQRRARLDSALERVGLAALVDRDYWSLSGGQRQRALVARGMIREPALLILDEPMNHLDPDAEEALLQDLLGQQRARRLALLLVTHDVAMAERHATHVATFADGRITTRGKVAEDSGA